LKKNRMLEDKLLTSSFITWFIENYPKSLRQMRSNEEFQNQFITLPISKSNIL